MPSAYVGLINTTLATATQTVDIANIDQSYRDLVLIINGWVTTRTGQYVLFNGDTTTTNYRFWSVRSSGTGMYTGRGNDPQCSDVFENSSTNISSTRLNIADYSQTDKYKSILVRNDNGTPNGVEIRAQSWKSTAAITAMTIKASGSTWGAGTTFALYGVKGS